MRAGTFFVYPMGLHPEEYPEQTAVFIVRFGLAAIGGGIALFVFLQDTFTLATPLRADNPTTSMKRLAVALSMNNIVYGLYIQSG